ncbi:MAG: hypothetical protein NW241_12520 [Bacteroidia bacterium]|nr:hypothetical protein [Bacteroidia bacterium]
MYLQETAIVLLQDIRSLLARLSAAQYAAPLEVFSGSTIGEHTRHLIEFFDCLIRQAPCGTVNYDLRARNELLGTDPVLASARIGELIQAVESEGRPAGLLLEVSYDLAGQEICRIPTTFERELVYTIEHAVHHLAIIKIGLRFAAPALELPEGFGVAISTLRHRQHSAAS